MSMVVVRGLLFHTLIALSHQYVLPVVKNLELNNACSCGDLFRSFSYMLYGLYTAIPIINGDDPSSIFIALSNNEVGRGVERRFQVR